MSIENILNTLLQLFSLNALINSPTSYQLHIPTGNDHISPTSYQLHIPTGNDHILTNQKSLFKFSKTFETGLSDHHKLISTAMKSGSFKFPPKMKDLKML